MHLKRFATVVWALAGVLAGSCPGTCAKPRQPKTVLDYLLLLPNERYFEVPRSERKGWLYQDKSRFGSVKPIVDIQHNYILFPGDGAQGTVQVALFRYHGRVLVAVRNDFEEGNLDFLRYEKGHWRNVTSYVMPVPYNEHYDYKLPRLGTTIRVTAARYTYQSIRHAPNEGKKVYDLVWTHGRFQVRR